MDTAALLEYRSEANYRRLLAGKSLFIIDEAQYMPEADFHLVHPGNYEQWLDG